MHLQYLGNWYDCIIMSIFLLVYYKNNLIYNRNEWSY